MQPEGRAGPARAVFADDAAAALHSLLAPDGDPIGVGAYVTEARPAAAAAGL